MAKKTKKDEHELGDYDSTYTAYSIASSLPTGSTYVGNGPSFLATMRLGDNSSTSGGTAELILNGNSGQIAWGTDNGNLNSNALYEGGVPFTFIVPSSTSPQTPAFFTVGDAPTVTYSGAPSYGAIVSCLVETEVNIGGTIMPTQCVSVALSGLAITFSDGLNPTSNPSSGYTDPAATEGGNCTVGSGSNFYGLMAQPIGGTYTAVTVTVTGNIQMVSTDPYFQNAGANLSFGSMWCKIYVYTNLPGGKMLRPRKRPTRRKK